MAQRAYNCFRVLTFVPFSPHSGEKQRELTEIDERYVQKQRANRVRGGLAPPLPLEAGCGSVGRAGVGCGLRSILSGYSALWKHRTDREKRLPGPGYTVSRQRARPLHARQAPGRQGDLRNTICTTGGSPWSTMPTSRRTRGEAHGAQIPRAPNIWVASMRSVRGCARGCVRGAHEILHELLMRSSMSCSSQVKSSQVKSSQV